ncbi:MAG: Asp-tRNA(Asn)/Glu-tRNA(Gln) amidotransferase subunit GatA [Actinomycetota bacterium]|nr:Asp-tRNA(Asn)/Glu-tRNA(Gln) amidotransferase subunit GatA [Actinomycetota bacterium]
MDLNFLSAGKLNNLLKKKEITSRQILDSVIRQAEKVDPEINCYISRAFEQAKEQAGSADKLIAKSEAGYFTGIPVGIKDNICTRGLKTTCGSRILENYDPVYNATVIDRLDSHNYVLTGKLNMDEFAMGSSNENSYFGPVKNPWDLSRVPGGSSGGPAACVASGQAICALGSDTGGSIRQPASLCGVVGLKPTYGRVSRYGLVAFASSLDQIGPLTRDVRDAAAMLNVICGHDPMDSTSLDKQVPDYTSYLQQDMKGLKVGVPQQLMVPQVDTQVRKAVEGSLKLLEDMGAEIEQVSLPSLEYALSVYYIIAPSEASSNLSRYDGVRYGYRAPDADGLRQMYKKSRSEGFGEEVKRRIMIGTYCLSAGYYDAYYEKAQKVRTLIINDFNQAFSKYDLLVSPTSPTTAFQLGERLQDPLMMYLSDICTIPVNLAGLPAISIPVGLSDNGLPIGFQFIGNILREDNILRAAYNLEQAVNFNHRPELQGN